MKLKEVLAAELRELFRDRDILLTIFGGVLLYVFFYPQPYLNQVVKELPVAVVDYDRSPLSRQMVFRLDATPQIAVAETAMSEREAKTALTQGRVKGIVVIPAHFMRDLYAHRRPTVAVGADASYFLIYGGIVKSAATLALSEGAEFKVASRLRSEIPYEAAKRQYTAYDLNLINLFNPENSYTVYVLPAVFVLILQQTMLIGLGILGGGITERIRRGVPGHWAQAPAWKVLLSRLALFCAIFWVHLHFYFGFGLELFGVPHLADPAELLTFAFPFVLATGFLGIFLGTLFIGRESATPTVMFSSLPLVFLAGFVWPVEMVPTPLVWLSQLFPSTPAIQGFLALNQMGASFAEVMPQYGLLWAQAAVFGLLAWRGLARQREQAKGAANIK